MWKKFLALLVFFFLFNSPAVAQISNIFPEPSHMPQPVLSYGNTSYHDSLGAREPFAIYTGNIYYLYYDCIEDFLNPSFESNWGTNGWSVWNATISATSERARFGGQSLKVITNGTSGGGAFTGNYFYNFDPGGNNPPSNLAIPQGLGIKDNEAYIASAYVWVPLGVSAKLLVKQYKDDPAFYNQNWLSALDAETVIAGNNSWQSISVKFTTSTQTRDITLSLISDTAATLYWDGVQLERLSNVNQTTPTAFPTDINFNVRLEDRIGWRGCVATSDNGISFTKKGPLEVSGVKGAWENFEKPGFAGTSFMSPNLFNYNGSWYSYIWEAGQPATSDPGIANQRRPGYWDLRAQIPNGIPRSGLIQGSLPLGPFTRISPSGPAVELTAAQLSQCHDGQLRTCVFPWGCDYLAAIGVPQLLENQWLLFLAGQTLHQAGVWEGTGGGTPDGCHAINAGQATSSSPISGWTTASYNPMFAPLENLNIGQVMEGAFYAYHRQSGWHMLFSNAIGGGAHAIRGVWTQKPVGDWPLSQSQEIINWDYIPWSGGARGNINLPGPLFDPQNPNKLLIYYGARKNQLPQGSGIESVYSYLFHDIGFMSLDLSTLAPVKKSQLVSQTPISESPQTAKFITRYSDISGTDNLNRLQFIINDTADWRSSTNYIRVMYANNSYNSSGATFNSGNFYLYGSNSANQNWGIGATIGSALSNTFTDVTLNQVRHIDVNTLELEWTVTFKSIIPAGTYPIYLALFDNNEVQDYVTEPHEVFYAYGANQYFVKGGQFTLPIDLPTPSPSYTVTDLKELLFKYGTNLDSGYKPVDGMVNMLDAGYVIKWIP